MGMSGLCFTYHSPDAGLSEDEWAEVCLDERDHPDPDGLYEWHDRAIDALRLYRPQMKETEPLVLDDGEGPVYFITSIGDIQMKPVKRYHAPDGVDEFAQWWGYCEAIRSAGPTFVYDLDYFEMIDINVDLDHARRMYYHLL